MDGAAFTWDDADRSVVFERRQLDLRDRFQAVLPERGLEVLVVEALTIEGRGQPRPVPRDRRRRHVEQPANRREASSGPGDGVIDPEERHEDEGGPGDRGIRSGHRRLEGVRGEEDRGEVEQRELAELALAGQAQGGQEERVDDQAADDELKRRDAEVPDPAAQVEHSGIVTQAAPAGGLVEPRGCGTLRQMPAEIRRVARDELMPWLECLTTTFLDRPDLPKIAEQLGPYWDFTRLWGAFDGRVVGTLRTWATELTVPGGAQVAAIAVAAVTVLPTHRRRGILRGMVAAEHEAARARGEVIGMLYATEAAIYGRFGYGMGVTTCTWTLDTSGTAFVGEPATGISFAPLDETTRDLMRDLYDRYRGTHVGEIRRREFSFGMDIGLLELAWETPFKGWVIVHRDPSGESDGFVRYGAEEKWEHHQPRSVARVHDLVALNDVAYDALWRFLSEIDLIATVRAERRSPAERLPWLLTNRRAAEPADVGDGLWMTLLDVPAALAARRYERPGDLVLEVIDGEPGTARTRVRLEAGLDGSACSTTRRKPDLTVHAGALGAAYLGGTPLRQAVLARGFEEHRPGALAAADALFRTLDAPTCMTFF